MEASVWIQKLVGIHMANDNVNGPFEAIGSSKELQQFIGDVNVSMVAISLNIETGAVTCSIDLDSINNAFKTIIISKTRPAVVTSANMAEIVWVTQLQDTPVNTLYQSVHSVYAPILQKTGKWGMNSKLQRLLVDLDEGLASTLRNTSDLKSSLESSFESIASVNDEYTYWQEMALKKDASTAECERAVYFSTTLQPLKADFDKQLNESFSTLMELVEKSHDALDDLWRQHEYSPYPKSRMMHLLDLISEQIIGVIQAKIGDREVMMEPLPQIKDELVLASDALGRWVEILKSLTGTFWALFSPNPWGDEPFYSHSANELCDRISKIISLRVSHDIMMDLVQSEESKDIQVDNIFKPFSRLNIFQCSKGVELAWSAATAQYNHAIKPTETQCAQRLASIFDKLQTQPGQLMREFKKYRDLVSRETIFRHLVAEREMLLGQLSTSLKSIQNEFKSRSHHSNTPKGRNFPNLITDIVWARQAITKVQETNQIVTSLIGAKSSYQLLSSELYDELRKYEREQFEVWSLQTMNDLKDKDSALSPSQFGRLMELDYSSGKLVVNYGDHLVTLFREIRLLIAMGFPVSAQIQQSADSAQKLYRHGVVLKQVAYFYNTIEQQMLPSQQSMLLQAAVAFERLVKNPSVSGGADEESNSIGSRMLNWENPQELESYIFKLKAAAEHLSSENRRLRKYHVVISDHIISLMSIDLVKNQAFWKETLNEIRSIILHIQDGGIAPELTITWRNHWDYQLYKALEYQYQVGLENLNENLPEMKVDLVFKQQKLQFRPTFEEIRAKYYRELKKFINLPSVFKGIGETRVFNQLIDQNSLSLSTVYLKAELLFQNLVKMHNSFQDWVLLGTVDLDEFVQESLTEISDWELNFRMLKQKGKDAEQLPSTIKVDCITVSTASVKATIDDHLQRMFDAMLAALRKAILVHIAEINDFVNKGMDILLKHPQTMAEIGEANARHAELSQSKLSIQSHFEAVYTKNKLLKSVSGSGIDASSVEAKWGKLELMLESHELMIKEQVNILRSAIDGRVQLFLGEMEKFFLRWSQLKPKSSDIGNIQETRKAGEFVKERVLEFSELEKTANQIMVDSQHFNVSPPNFSEMELIRQDLSESKEMWGLCEKYLQELDQIRAQDWISFRAKSHQLDEFVGKWSQTIQSRPTDAVSAQLLKDLDSYREVVPNFKLLRGDNWTTEHWGELFRILSVPKGITVSELNVGHFLDLRDAIVLKISLIKELNNQANGEVAIREAIQELDIWGAGAQFSLTEYQDAKGNQLSLIKDWKETLTQVGDNQSLLSSLKDSPYFNNFAEKAQSWEHKLAELDEYLRQLNIIQRRWVYLEPIFSRGALPSEQSRFHRIDEDFRSVIQSIMTDVRIVSILFFPNIRSILVALMDQLERCQKALNEFLEQKRAKFARFYFIGDDDLLEILGQAMNPQVIQAHLKKLFAGVFSVRFNAEMTSIDAMQSLSGEIVSLKNPVTVTAEVESWLQSFEIEMKSTLKILLQECVAESNIFKYPSQIICLAEYLHFTSSVEKCIQNQQGFEQLEKQLRDELEKYTTFDSSTVADKTERGVIELKIKPLILDIIHFLDVIEQLQKVDLLKVTDWEWQRQLRFYLNSENACVIRMNNAEFEYTYEYQGNPARLVHTPLTDKCYLTLTQAMSSGFGGNPFGPAGTGKTESVKALAVLFGRQVLVFNCDEGIDYKSMGRIFVGLVKCGAWGCFDEFNRLEEAVLSAVSQQIQVIQAAIKRKENSVVLLGKTVDLDKNSGIFVTLNPAGKGYGGRQRLPDNLKQLFRSVAMTHPNNELISEVILFSEGFHLGRELGKKVVSIFTLCKQFLTAQQHYDWGLRPLKAVLELAGSLLHEQKKIGPVGAVEEAIVVVKAIRVSTLSKLTFGDAQRFSMLMNDIFPETDIHTIIYQELQKALQESYVELGLIYIESQAEKVFQLYEACKQRMGVVLVGPSGSGKSTIWRLLKNALHKTGQRLVSHITNPKAVDRQSLLGNMDMDTREWTDGILTYASRQAVKEALDVHTWIISDGDIDPEWIESLNSVLDDNRLLTMPNGERIQFGPNINFIFETHNLNFASPATVSRMGMIYLSDETLDINVLVNSWIEKEAEPLRVALMGWIKTYFYQSIIWIRQNCEMAVETTKAGLVLNGLSHIHGATSKLQFLFGLIRGLGSNLFLEQRLLFSNELFQWANEQVPDPKKILDYWVSSSGKLETYTLEEPASLDITCMQDLDRLPVIATPDLQRSVDMVMPWLNDKHPLLLVGSEGAGKYTLLRHCFSKLKSTSVSIIHCNSQTKSSHIVQRLFQTCVASTSIKGRVLRPKDCERLILYFKDINLPKPDKYETVEIIQFLQQLLTYRGFYDSSLEWVSIENIQIVASMNPSTTIGRHKLSVRFSSIVRVCYISYTDREQLQSIYQIMLQPVLESCLPNHRVWSHPKSISKLASTIVSIFEQTVQKFRVDMHSHYVFTPRDISRLVLSLGRFVYQENDENELIKVIAYESQRLFQDRLVGHDARQSFQSLLFSILQSEWNYQGTLQGIIYAITEAGELGSLSDVTTAKKLGCLTMDQYKEKLTKQLRVYERDNRDLHISLYPEMLELISRMERVLSQSGGSLLLAGRPGIPYVNISFLISFYLGYTVVSPKVLRGDSTKAFLADLKAILQITGVTGEDAVLLLQDYQLVEPSYIESINSLLSGSEVAGIYAQDELDLILNSLKDGHSQAGFRGSVYEYFVSRVRKHLHVILVMDHALPQFIINCESNPALYTRCQMLWMDAFSNESMTYLANEIFNKSGSLTTLKDKDALIKELLTIHQSNVFRDGTPKHFIEYLAMYNQVYSSKLDSLCIRQNYLLEGLKKLNEASTYVDKLSSDAKRQQTELTQKQQQADAALGQITDSMVQASEQKKEMELLTISLKEEETKVLVQKQAVQKELSEVEPIIKSAKAAVGEIRSESLSEIRSLRAPPPAIRDVLEGVLRLMGVLDMSWNSMKGFLGQRSIKEEIMNFDAHSITKQTREAVFELIKQKQSSFEEATIRRVSVAAAPLALWVKANLQYSTVVEKVAPLEQNLQRLSATLDASRSWLSKLKDQLSAVDAKVQALKDDFSDKTREAESLKISLDNAMGIIKRSQGLLEKLSGEGDRWNSQVSSIGQEIQKLPRNGLLAAAFIVYLAGAPEDMRHLMVRKWEKITGINNFNCITVMNTESEQLIWKSQGLPADTLSLENAIITLNNRAISLLIDPSGQATEWIKHYLKDKKPEIISQSNESFMRSLELAVRFGKTLIVQDLTHIEPVLMPLIRGDFQKQGPRLVIEIGDKTIDYNSDFKLYFTTRRSTFTVSADIVGYVNDINFTITRAGLSGQLLGITLKHERPELEVQKMNLLKKEEELKVQLSNLEDQLLKALASSEGNILENTVLLTSLNETKEKSNIIAKSLKESQKLQESLDSERDKFAPVSTFGSSLFFVISDMQKINTMYRFSLSSFLRIFEKALKSETTTAQDQTELRIKLLMTTMERLTFEYISRSIFKADQQMFALHMIHELHPTLFGPQEWELFIGQVVLVEVEEKSIEIPDWVPEERRPYFRQLQTLLPNLSQSLGFGDKEIWINWISSPNCDAIFPREKTSAFQRLLVVQALRPDRLLTSMAAFSCNALAMDNLAPPALELKQFFDKETISSEPVLFITTSGADPTQELRDLAMTEVGAENYYQISMGQGQGELAIELLRKASNEGGWIFLQNIHLVINWVPILEKELLFLKPHSKFRLWMTSESHVKFPASLLENCLKVTIEAPPGVKKNLQRIYQGWTPEFIQRGTLIRAQALFALAWFHAVIQERRNYIPQGWNKFYEFSAADLRSSADVVDIMCTTSESPQWAVLHGLLQDAIYGGRIDDHHDALILHTYLHQLFYNDVFTINGKGPTRKICKNFVLPRTNEYAAYHQLITELPEIDNVELFGLPANIDRTLQKLTSQAVIEQLKTLRHVDVKQHKFNKDKWSQELMPLLQLWKKLNGSTNLLQKKLAVQSDADPIPAFFNMELSSALELIRQIHTDLSNISKLLRGTILLTNDIYKIGTNLLHGETPDRWMQLWEGPESAQVYIRSVISKAIAVDTLRDTASAGIKESIVLCNLFNPITFLNAQRQQTSRILRQPMDSLQLVSEWNLNELKNCPLRIAVQGLLLQGCNFDGERLLEANVNDPIFVTAPTCYIGWVAEKSVSTKGKLQVPLYMDRTRQKVVATLTIPCVDAKAPWILAGVGCFLNP
ncbi:hypothetical protein BDV3_002952 [Batrachochytrium dendrobatidis]